MIICIFSLDKLRASSRGNT